MIGLPASGKSTLSRLFEKELRERHGKSVEVLDGDEDRDERDQIGDAAVWKADELPSGLRVASVVGKRTDDEATSSPRRRSDQMAPCLCSCQTNSTPTLTHS